jgi:hypothetical protein
MPPNHAMQRTRRGRRRSSLRDPDAVYRGCHRCVPSTLRPDRIGTTEDGCAASLSLGR